ncbi:hypothetical protein pdam_00019535 [Pocillopora damicornis]|uniref:Uncharacterized protein n=1 Tax=Pocillopora damicornis TaxID=46731 RepID=A0A3M6V2G8_POCDA|nr:hypothetical protein pdam_00019535 [Pocillopora damicornis]
MPFSKYDTVLLLHSECAREKGSVWAEEQKVTAHLYFLSQLKHAKVPANDLLSLYTTCICPVARYACPVFDTALPQYLSNQLEHQQKQALEVFNIPTLYDMREAIVIQCLKR